MTGPYTSHDLAINAENLRKELRWLEDIIVARLDLVRDRRSRPAGPEVVRLRDPEEAWPMVVNRETGRMLRLYAEDRATMVESPGGWPVIPVGTPVEVLEMDGEWALVGGWGQELPDGGGATRDMHLEGWLPLILTEPVSNGAGPDPEAVWTRFYTSGDLTHLQPPEVETEGSNYARFIYQNQLSYANRVLLALAVSPHVAPELLDRLMVVRNEAGERPLSEVGGVIGENFRGFLPTGLTWQFLLAGYDIGLRLVLHQHLNGENPLLREKVISFGEGKAFEPVLSGPILIDHTWLRVLCVGDVGLGEEKGEGPDGDGSLETVDRN